MSKIIIYDDKNILIAKLEKTETDKKRIDGIIEKIEYKATFNEFEITKNKRVLKKQLRRIEKIFRSYKKEQNKWK